MSKAEFELAIPASERPQTYVLDRAAEAQISFSAPCSRTLSACVFRLTWEAKFHNHKKKTRKSII